MGTIKCLIVDDEPIARDIIKAYCMPLENLEVVAVCSSALEAKTVLQKQKVDIIFLDINMPVLDGIAFLKTLKSQPQVIFTTAYKDFALDAFDLAACDYLLKPFSLERFIMAVDKATEKLGAPPSTSENSRPGKEIFFFIKTEGKIYKIFHDEILYAEAQGNNTKIVTTQATLLPAMSFSSFEVVLPKSVFLRVHRSFIINKSKIAHVEGNRVIINKNEIPIGSNYRENFLKELGI